MAYGKVFESLYTGSMVGSGLGVFAVWTYCIANAKPPGTIELNPKIMATIFGCQIIEVESCIAKLCEPDPYSRSKEHDGRRLVKEGEFLYFIPTWEKYNQLRNEIARRLQNRDAQRRWREKQRNADVSMDKQNKPIHTHTTDADPAHTEGVGAGVELLRVMRSSVYAEGRRDRDAFLVLEASRLHREGLTADRFSALLADCSRRARKSPGGLLATLLRGDGWKEREIKAAQHIPNMKLGAKSCNCAECISFRSRKESKDSA